MKTIDAIIMSVLIDEIVAIGGRGKCRNELGERGRYRWGEMDESMSRASGRRTMIMKDADRKTWHDCKHSLLNLLSSFGATLGEEKA